MSLDLDEIERMDKEREEQWNNPLGIVEKNGKRYIDGEEILISVRLIPLRYFLFRIFVLLLGVGAPIYVYHRIDAFNIYIAILLYGLLLYKIISEIIKFYKYKLHITEKYFITENNEKRNKKHISILKEQPKPGWGSPIVKIYYKNKFFCEYVAVKDKERNSFFNVLFLISDNELFKINNNINNFNDYRYYYIKYNLFNEKKK